MSSDPHGTLARYRSGCTCPDCVFAYRFVTLALDYEEPAPSDLRQFATPRLSTSRPYPARDLVARIGQPNTAILSDMIGVSRKTIGAWLRTGTCLTAYEADLYSCRAGFHPVQIWGERWYEDVMA